MYVIIWEFVIKEGLAGEFEKAYGKGGVWERFFKKGAGFLSTELLQNKSATNKYVTIDRWQSRQEYDAFRNFNLEEYASIDVECERLTEQEIRIGDFEIVS